ncbi:acyl--CoA ligase [Parasphingopyxis algicola]|uniref:class I adenylate-forming enzyme family protein n=1 Tax=Parasphingopyxis algicola TaxID=2026624 RepID=UPI0015A2C79F|nr:class I adenylate-forming enzyme family protein [Parasphingopyxis algicola]QLC26015.1 acyl--CoA ligase [Parasphingopyxis algicola]
MTIARGIRCAATAAPDKLALLDSDGASRTYRELTGRITQTGGLAASRELDKGDVVALIAPNCIEYIETVAGLSERGIIVATLNPALSAEELDGIFRDCEPRLVIAAESVALPDPAPETLRLGDEFERALAAAPPPPPAPAIDERESFSIAYTSGTTGHPKGVLLSHRSRCLLFAAMATEYGCFGRDDHFLALAPMCHGAGLAFAFAPLFHGGRCTLVYSSEPDDILEALADHEPNGIFVVPTHLHRLFAAEAGLLERYRGRHRLRTIISNAAALAPALKKAAVAYFGEGLLHETYGSTEGGIVTNIRPADLLRKPRSVGTAFLNMEIELRREDGSIADSYEPGELFCRSPYTFNGYLNRPEDTAAAIVDGWVTVGDLAVRDPDGFITITDRKKDMIVTGGMNVYPREVENAIEQLTGVAECAVVGEPDDEWGESLHAFVVRAAGRSISVDDILAACRSALAPYKVPKRVSFLGALPRNASGKIMKRSLVDAAADR